MDGEPPRRSLLLPLAGVAVLAIAALLAVDVLAPSLVPGLDRLPRPWERTATACRTTTVEIVAVPEVAPVLSQVLTPLEGRSLADGNCLHTDIRSQSAADTASATRILPLTEAPQIWIPDSSTWLGRVTQWPLTPVASFASSPVVLAGGAAALSARGWDKKAPSWPVALTSPTSAAALQDPATAAPGLVALLGLFARLGKDTAAQRGVVAAVLTASRTAGQTLDAARLAGVQADPKGPVVVTSEVAVVEGNRTQGSTALVAVYPEAVAPLLDFPLVRVSPKTQDAAHTTAVDAVLAALTAPAAQVAARSAGLRDPKGVQVPEADGVSSAPLTVLPSPSIGDVQSFLVFLQSLSRPSRLLTVMDVSLSMRAQVPGTDLTRIELAAQSAAAAGNLLSGESSAGLWAFALQLPGGKPWQELSPIEKLGAKEGPATHREALLSTMAKLSGKLSGGGTALYATTLAAVQAMRATYDPRAVNSVVLFTDGTNENDTSLSLTALAKDLKADAAANPQRPIVLIAIGLGPTADMAALRTITEAVDGKAYQAQTPLELQTVLFDALSRRPATTS